VRGALLGHDCTWRRCACRDCGDPTRNRSTLRKLRKALRQHERDAWRRELEEENRWS